MPTDRTRVPGLFLLLLLVLAPAALTVVRGQAPGSALPADKTVKLSADEAARLAKDARAEVSVQVGPGLELSLWASDRLVIDPVALDLDPRGTAYVASTSRNNLPLDIRQHPTWVPIVHTLKTVDDLVNFYNKELAPERSKQNPWIPDLNSDGSRDLRDFKEIKERLYRIQDTDGDGLADVSQVMAEGFNDDPSWDVAGGVLYRDGELIFGVPPGVYRLKDENGDGVIDSRVAISEGYNVHPSFGGHGISGVTQGPDGRIYWEVGDMGMTVVDKSGRRWSYPNQGAVLRSEPDGSGFEVYAAGIRNLQEFAFDEYGNLLSVDNDGDHAGETERVVYITDGSDSGWRSNWQYGKYTDPLNNRYNVWMDESMFKPRFDGQAAYIVPPIAPFHAGPAGVAYDTGTTLTDEWRKTLLVASFPGAASNARIHALSLQPQGAGFTLANDRVLLQGILTVGMRFGPDGALYLADWITGWDSKNKGRIWKVDGPNAAASPIRVEVKKLLGENLASRTPADVALLMRHVDVRVRQKAQFDLVRRGDAQTLLASANNRAHQLARIHAIWGIAQLARKDAQQASALVPFLKDEDGEIRAQAAKMLGDVRYAPAADALMPLLKDAAPRVRFFAAEALGRIAHKPAAGALVAMLADNNDQDVYLRHAGSVALSRIDDASALAALDKHPSRGVRIAAVVALRRMRSPEVARFLADADEQVVTEAARAINDDGGIEGALPALARTLGESRFTGAPLLRRAISANLRVGTSDAVTRVAAFAADRARTEELRAEAIGALSVWPAPSPMDRVDGFYIGQPAPRDGAAARAAVLGLFDAIGNAGDATTDIKIAMAEAAGRLGVSEVAPVLLKQLQADESSQVRLASLRALQAIKVPNMDEVMTIAFGDSDATVRRAALAVLPDLSIPSAQKVQHLTTVMKTGSLSDRQGALEVLGTLKSPEATKVLGSYLTELTAGKTAPELQIDVLDAVEASGSQPLKTRLETYLKSRKAETVTDAFPEALLRGGNVNRGRLAFSQHPAAECTRCHTVRGRGTDVGPNLTTVGATLSREQLVEAMLRPNARIAPGFGTLSLTLQNGQKIVGTLRDETDTHLILITGTPPVEQRIAKTDVKERTDPTSAMPPMGLLLKPREIRDLVEFLSTLR